MKNPVFFQPPNGHTLNNMTKKMAWLISLITFLLGPENTAKAFGFETHTFVSRNNTQNQYAVTLKQDFEVEQGIGIPVMSSELQAIFDKFSEGVCGLIARAVNLPLTEVQRWYFDATNQTTVAVLSSSNAEMNSCMNETMANAVQKYIATTTHDDSIKYILMAIVVAIGAACMLGIGLCYLRQRCQQNRVAHQVILTDPSLPTDSAQEEDTSHEYDENTPINTNAPKLGRGSYS